MIKMYRHRRVAHAKDFNNVLACTIFVQVDTEQESETTLNKYVMAREKYNQGLSKEWTYAREADTVEVFSTFSAMRDASERVGSEEVKHAMEYNTPLTTVLYNDGSASHAVIGFTNVDGMQNTWL